MERHSTLNFVSLYSLFGFDFDAARRRHAGAAAACERFWEANERVGYFFFYLIIGAAVLALPFADAFLSHSMCQVSSSSTDGTAQGDTGTTPIPLSDCISRRNFTVSIPANGRRGQVRLRIEQWPL